MTVSHGKVTFIGGRHGEKRDIWVKANFKQDTEVYIFVTTNWKNEAANNTFGVGVYGVDGVVFD